MLRAIPASSSASTSVVRPRHHHRPVDAVHFHVIDAAASAIVVQHGPGAAAATAARFLLKLGGGVGRGTALAPASVTSPQRGPADTAAISRGGNWLPPPAEV